MSAPAGLLSPTLPRPDSGTTTPEHLPLAAHIHSRLPKIWIGYALTLAVFALFALNLQGFHGPVDLEAAALVLYLVAWVYWLFCVHRIHRVLKETTQGSYAISPRRAVGFQFIPLYSLVWGFKWPKRIAELVNSRGDSHRMSKYLPGTVLFAAAFVGQSGFLAPLHLLLFFATGHYITRKLRPLVPPLAQTTQVRRREHQLNLAISAGIGAVFTFKLFQAFWNLNHVDPNELLHEIVAITLVSLGVVLFIEPLAEVWRKRIGLEEHHARLIGRSWKVKATVFAILALTSLSHGFLHNQIDDEMKKDPIRTLIGIVGATLISGAITYAWVSGACREKPRAARFGLMTGAIVGLLTTTVILSLTKVQPPKAPPSQEASVLEQATADSQRGVGEVNPEILINAAKSYQDPNVRKQWALDLRKTLLPWTLLGLIGGLAVDRRWGRSPGRNVALAIFLSGAFLFPALASLTKWLNMDVYTPTAAEMMAHIFAVGGWALSLAVFPFSDKLFDTSPGPTAPMLDTGITHHPAA